jgi:hypothetical protein
MTTAWFCDGTVRVQGVVQVWIWLVLISAPGGSDSKLNAWSCSDDELDDREVQPVSENPTTAATAAASSMCDTAPLPSYQNKRKPWDDGGDGDQPAA